LRGRIVHDLPVRQPAGHGSAGTELLRLTGGAAGWHVGLIAALRQISGAASAGRRDRGIVSQAESSDSTRGSLEDMPTLVRGPQPAEFEALLERRRRLGQDLFDEVWEGVLHINPAPSGRHGRLETQLTMLLGSVAASAGLVITGQFNLVSLSTTTASPI
jgi:hypothetical protein